MIDLITIAGSPSHPSRSAAVLDHIQSIVETYGLTTDSIRVRDLNPEQLLHAHADGDSIRDAVDRVEAARAVIIATPVYKAAYTGILKAFLDLLPQNALANKLVFPIATGGSPAHLLAIDYALKPVLSALGAQHILSGLYIQDSQFQYTNGIQLDASLEQRLQTAIQRLVDHLLHPELDVVTGK